MSAGCDGCGRVERDLDQVRWIGNELGNVAHILELAAGKKDWEMVEKVKTRLVECRDRLRWG